VTSPSTPKIGDDGSPDWDQILADMQAQLWADLDFLARSQPFMGRVEPVDPLTRMAELGYFDGPYSPREWIR